MQIGNIIHEVLMFLSKCTCFSKLANYDFWVTGFGFNVDMSFKLFNQKTFHFGDENTYYLTRKKKRDR